MKKLKRLERIKEEYKRKVFTEKMPLLISLKRVNHDLAQIRKEFRVLSGMKW